MTPAAGKEVTLAAYHCSTGHTIPAGELEALSTVVSLDSGARVRLCAEHGAPVWVAFPSGTESRPDDRASPDRAL